jgi:nicotinamide-nucleotide amidase
MDIRRAKAPYEFMSLDPLIVDARRLIESAQRQRLTVALAESCTGGLAAACITAVPGSSAVFERGFVTYSNEAKTEMLGVSPHLIVSLGAVSAEVAREMAAGALMHSRADLAGAITGIAGPGGGNAQKPVGLVHFAAIRRGAPPISEERRFGDIGRNAVREASVAVLLAMLQNLLDA